MIPFIPGLYCGGGGGQGGGNPGVMGAGGIREAGEERAGGGMSKRGGSREKWEKFRNIGTIFHNRKSTRRREPLRKGAGTGSTGCGRRDVQTPLSPPPPHYTGATRKFLATMLQLRQLFRIA